MTMTDFLCDVCLKNPPIGVACTSMPYSCAYCEECATKGADPEICFMVTFDDVGLDFHKLKNPDAMLTFKDGRYMTYREWAPLYGRKTTNAA